MLNADHQPGLVESLGPADHNTLVFSHSVNIEPGQTLNGTIRMKVHHLAPPGVYDVIVDVGYKLGPFYFTLGHARIDVEVIP